MDCPIVVTVIGAVGDGVLGNLLEAEVLAIVGVVGVVEIGGEFPVVDAAGIGSEIVIGAPVEEDWSIGASRLTSGFATAAGTDSPADSPPACRLPLSST